MLYTVYTLTEISHIISHVKFSYVKLISHLIPHEKISHVKSKYAELEHFTCEIFICEIYLTCEISTSQTKLMHSEIRNRKVVSNHI